MEFTAFDKIPRWSREITISEKIDGTNASIFIGEDGEFLTGSKSRWITPENDHYGFSKWAHDSRDDLMGLGAGHHFGEWWGSGIQRRYDQERKRFSLFNTQRWEDRAPACCDVVPVLYTGILSGSVIADAVESLRKHGSMAAPGFMQPEGIIIWHDAAQHYFKKTLLKDEQHKGTVTCT